MCYCKSGCKFSRISVYCKVMFCNMIVLLVEYELIKIMLLKVKEFCWVVEFLIMFLKNDLVVNCCLVFFCLCDDVVVVKLFDELGFCYSECLGGYFCILKCGFCVGDNVLMVFVELVGCLLDIEVEEVDEDEE